MAFRIATRLAPALPHSWSPLGPMAYRVSDAMQAKVRSRTARAVSRYRFYTPSMSARPTVWTRITTEGAELLHGTSTKAAATPLAKRVFEKEDGFRYLYATNRITLAMQHAFKAARMYGGMPIIVRVKLNHGQITRPLPEGSPFHTFDPLHLADGPLTIVRVEMLDPADSLF